MRAGVFPDRIPRRAAAISRRRRSARLSFRYPYRDHFRRTAVLGEQPLERAEGLGPFSLSPGVAVGLASLDRVKFAEYPNSAD